MKLDPIQKGASLVWRKDHFLGIAGRYRDLLELLLDNLEYVAYIFLLPTAFFSFFLFASRDPDWFWLNSIDFIAFINTEC